MPIPLRTLNAYEKTRVDIAIETFANIENPTVTGLNCVKTQAVIKNKTDEYCLGVTRMSEGDLEKEGHKSSRMAMYMEGSTDPRPSPYCDCHAMISGRHPLDR